LHVAYFGDGKWACPWNSLDESKEEKEEANVHAKLVGWGARSIVRSRLNLVPVQRYFKPVMKGLGLFKLGLRKLASIRELIFPHGLM
jgi:hypothetical protein